MFYSLIIPLYNRPDEIRELLESLLLQTYKHFEVIVVEDGSKPELSAREIVMGYEGRLDVKYFYKENAGQGFARNHGFQRAKGDYFIIFDSDIIVPPHYMEAVHKGVTERGLDAFGGPDAAHDSFTDVQKAISYSMTSYFTTGGIRGKKNNLGPYHPRSFNMGISRKVYDTVGGFIIPFMGEDIEFSIRIINAGFKTGLIEDAYVYHKRRTNFKQFFKQIKFFGRARINIHSFFPKELKYVHFFPALFTLFLVSVPIMILVWPWLGWWMLRFLLLYTFAIFAHATSQHDNLKIGAYSVAAAYTQLVGYGVGFMDEAWHRWVKKEATRAKQ